MSGFKKVMTALTAISFVALPVAANATDASKLSLSPSVRAGKSVSSKDHLHGSGVIVAVLAFAAVVAGIIVVAKNNDSKPDSL